LVAVIVDLLALGLAFGHTLGSDRWVRSELVEDVVLAGGSLTLLGLALSGIVVFFGARLRHPKAPSLPLSLDCLGRLHKALEFFPEPLPGDWSPALSPRGTAFWRQTELKDPEGIAGARSYVGEIELHATTTMLN
jgi:hypothetical protein